MIVVVMVSVVVIAIPISIVVPPVLYAIPPGVIRAPAVFAFFIQRMTAAARLRDVLTAFGDGKIQSCFCPRYAMLTLLPIVRLRARGASQNECGTEKGCAHNGARTETFLHVQSTSALPSLFPPRRNRRH